MTVSRRRGRPAKVATTASATQVLAAAPTTEAAGASKPNRRRRASVGDLAMKLSAPTRPGFVRRWMNDAKNRLAQAEELAYDFVTDTGIQSSDTGSRISRLVGTGENGEPLRAYLMETPVEEYQRGIDEREENHRQIEQAIIAGRDSTGTLTGLNEDPNASHGEIKIGQR